MRNLKRALSLTLASVMLLGMMVVGSSAAGYPDVTEEENVEAIEVLQTVGVMEGDNNGNFNPDDYVTREQMAVIMSKLLNLNYNYYQGTNPFSDVPAWAAPYVAACAANGITSGIGGGMYGAGQNVNAVQAALMMLKALGYFQYQDDFGESYVLATVKQATEVGLFDHIDSKAENALSRNEVAQMALNALRSDMVTFTGDVGTKIPTEKGDVVVGYKAEYTPRTSTLAKYHAIEGRTSDVVGGDNINRGQYYIQLGEELYDGDLKLNSNAADDFGRPSRAWEYKGKAIGTYAKKELLREAYTSTVTGEDLYNLLTRDVINDYALDVFVDGALVAFDKNDLVRSNKNSIRTSTAPISGAITGRGVKTEVYVDPNAGRDGEIDVVVINTYLAKANADYNTKGETISLQVYDRPAGTPVRVDVEDVPAIEGMKEGDLVLVNWASESPVATTKDVLIVKDVAETLSDVAVTKFSKTSSDDSNSQKNDDYVTSLTTGGNEYKDNFNAFYEDTTLGDYNGELLTNRTYDIFLDQYGYFIGARLHSGTDNYVFISAVDMANSALGLHNSDALGIFADGTMKTIKVDVVDTNSNIKKVRDDYDAGKFSILGTVGGANEFKQWDKDTKEVQRWFTYTENNGVYTLTPVTRYALYDPAKAVTVDTDKISLRASVCDIATGNAYGNDDSVYITAELTDADKGNEVVKEVTGTYTGVQSVRLTYGGRTLTNDWICAVYDKNNSIIAAVVVGEAEGSTDNYAYILSGANSEAKPDESDNNYYWTFDAIMGGEKQTMTIKSRYSKTVNNLEPGKVQQLIFDAEGYVTTIKDLYDYTGIDTKGTNNDKVYGNAEYDNNVSNPGAHFLGDYDVYHMTVKDAVTASNGLRLTFSGNTLSIDNPNNTDDRGLAVMSGAKAVLKQSTNGKWSTDDGYTVQDAFNLLADARPDSNDFYFYGEIVAILNASGRAEWVFFYDKTDVVTGNKPGYDNDDRGDSTTLPAWTDLGVNDTKANDNLNIAGRYHDDTHKLYLQFSGNAIPEGASKIKLKNVNITERAFTFGGVGTGSVLRSVTQDITVDVQANGTSYVAVLDFASANTNTMLPSTIEVDVPDVSAKVPANGKDNGLEIMEWYVKYDSAEPAEANRQKTVSNVAGSAIQFTVELPAGYKNVTYKFDTGTTVTGPTPAFANITGKTTYTAKLTSAVTVQPVIKLAVDGSKLNVQEEMVSGGESRSEYQNAYKVAGITTTVDEEGNAVISGFSQVSLTNMLNNDIGKAQIKLMRGGSQAGYVWVGLNYTSPKVNGNYATSVKIEKWKNSSDMTIATTPTTLTAGVDNEWYNNGVLYQWYGIAEVKDSSGNQASNINTDAASFVMQDAAYWTVRLTWNFAGTSETIVETFRVDRAAPVTATP